MIITLAGCSLQKAQSPGFSELSFNAIQKAKASKLKGVVPAIALDGEQVYFGILGEHIYELGKIANAQQPGLFMKKLRNSNELSIMTAKLRSFKSLSGTQQMMETAVSFKAEFKKIVFSDISEQRLLVETLRSLTSFDQKERGCFVRISEETTYFKIYVEQVFTVGKEDEVKFRFPIDNGVLSTIDKNGDLLIATVHSHNHDKGLSGLSPEEQVEGKGDISNVKFTGIPWIVIGTKKLEAGYSTNHGVILTEELATENLALYALWRVAIR
jgi:hypothetical protein